MISVIDFKKKYPRQYKRLINYYGRRENIFDIQAAILMYIRKDDVPKCELCGESLAITKKFRNSSTILRYHKHINTKKIISKEELLQAKIDNYKILSHPNKLLTRTDQVEVACKKHGTYKVNIGNFLDGMQCQKCYHELRIGSKRTPHSEETKKQLSKSKLGKKINLSNEAKKLKSQNQKIAWERRKLDKLNFEKYIANLSFRRKKYIEQHGYCFPNKEKTGLEIKFEQFLIDNSIKYITQYILNGKKFDFYLTDMFLLVEIDGEYWHKKESSIKNDIEKHKICVEKNIQLIRISSDNFDPTIIFKDTNTQDNHTKQILKKRGINGF